MANDKTGRQYRALSGLPRLKGIAKLLAHQAARQAAGANSADVAAVSLATLSTASVITGAMPGAAITISTCTSV